MGDRYVRVCGHVLQEMELFRRKANFGCPPLQAPRSEVDFDVVEAEHGWSVGDLRQTPQRGAYTGQQLWGTEGLVDVVIGAGVEGFHLVLFGVADGQHDDRDV